MTRPDNDSHHIMRFFYFAVMAVLALIVITGVWMCRKRSQPEKVTYSQQVPR